MSQFHFTVTATSNNSRCFSASVSHLQYCCSSCCLIFMHICLSLILQGGAAQRNVKLGSPLLKQQQPHMAAEEAEALRQDVLRSLRKTLLNNQERSGSFLYFKHANWQPGVSPGYGLFSVDCSQVTKLQNSTLEHH